MNSSFALIVVELVLMLLTNTLLLLTVLSDPGYLPHFKVSLFIQEAARG